MARKLYAKKRGRDSNPKGILWIAMILALMLLIIPILWMNYPFKKKSFRNFGKIPLERRGIHVVVQGKIPKEVVRKESIGKSNESEKTGNVIVAKIEKKESIKGGGTLPKPQKHAITVNPYVDEEKARLERKKNEDKLKQAVSTEALKELEKNKKLVVAKTEKNKEGDSFALEAGKKGGIYSLISPAKEELGKKEKEKEKEKTKHSVASVKKSVVKDKTVKSVSSSNAPVKKRTSNNITYWVQVGAFTKKANALNAVKRLKSLGYDSVIRKMHHAKYGALYLVRIPVYGNETSARKLSSALAKKLGEKPIVVKARK